MPAACGPSACRDYSFLCAIAWMVVEGVNLYAVVVIVLGLQMDRPMTTFFRSRVLMAHSTLSTSASHHVCVARCTYFPDHHGHPGRQHV
jgi:hypothetical protein